MRRLGRYELEEEIGRGGMAVVFRARDERLGTWVAVKVLSAALARDDEALARFEREARAAAAVEHPGVARLLDAGVEGATRFLVFELLTGGTLADRLRRDGPLPWREAVRFAASVARSLGALHEAGIVHRDVKPVNVLLDAHGNPKLADFGLARVENARDSITATGEVIGTLEYLSPEQADGRPSDARTDLHGLGALLHTLLVGRPPFEGAGFALLKTVLTRTPPDVRANRPDVPAPVARLVARLLAKDPAARGASAAHVAAELEALLAVRPRRAALPAGVALAAGVLAGFLAGFLAGRSASPTAAAPGPPARVETPRVAAKPPAAPALEVLDTWGRPAINHAAGVRGVAWISSTQVIAASEDGAVVRWDPSSGRRLTLRRDGPHIAAFTARSGLGLLGTTAARGTGGHVELFDATQPRSLGDWPSEDREPCVALSDDGTLVAFGSGPSHVKIVNWRAGPEGVRDIALHDGAGGALATVSALAFTRAGHLLGGAGRFVFCVPRGHPEGLNVLKSDDDIVVTAVAGSHDGERFAVGDTAGHVALYDMKGAGRRAGFAAHQAKITALAFTPDGRRLVTASVDPRRRVARVWDLASLRVEHELAGHAAAEFNDVAVSPDGKTVATASSDTSLGFFDIESGEERRDPRGHRGRVAAIALSDDGAVGVSVGADRASRTWDAQTGAVVEPRDVPEGGPYMSAAFGGARRRALLALATGDAVLLGTVPRAEERRHLDRPKVIIGTEVFAVTPGPPGEVFETRGGEVIQTELATGQELALAGLQARALAIAFAAPRTLVIVDERKDVVFWDTEEHLDVGSEEAGATCLAVSADGTRALTGGTRGELGLWDVTRRARIAPVTLGGTALAVQFATRDGALAAAVTEDAALLLVEVATGREIGRLDFHDEDDPPVTLAASRTGADLLYVGTSRGVIRKVAVRR